MRKLIALLCIGLFSACVYGATSPDGTLIGPAAPAPSFTDDKAVVWSICNVNFACRNGIPTNGHATLMRWYGGKVYAKSPNAAAHWWGWTGIAPSNWKDTGTAVDPMPDLSSAAGTRVPDAASFTDKNGSVWSLGGKLGDASRPVLKDGQQYVAGVALQLEWLDGNVYAFQADNSWWQATASGWTLTLGDPNAAHNNGITVNITVTPSVVVPLGGA